jgi:hypothetical protein
MSGQAQESKVRIADHASGTLETGAEWKLERDSA